MLEPIRFSINHGDEAEAIGELVATGEMMTTRYYAELRPILSFRLADVLIPEVIGIVDAYAARMPLSDEPTPCWRSTVSIIARKAKMLF